MDKKFEIFVRGNLVAGLNEMGSVEIDLKYAVGLGQL